MLPRCELTSEGLGAKDLLEAPLLHAGHAVMQRGKLASSSRREFRD